MHTHGRIWVLQRLAAALFLAILVLPARAVEDELVAAALAVAEKGAAAPAAQRALIIARNKDFQRLALNGVSIPPDVFENCQGWYVDTMTRYAEEEAQALGIKVHRQLAPAAPRKPGQKYGTFQPGTDLDLITDATTPDQIAKLQGKLNDRISSEVNKGLPAGGEPPSWVHANDVDLMADPVRTTPENFRKIAEQNNFAYERPGAARFEAWKRTLEENPTGARPANFDDLADYLDEMKSCSARRGEQISVIQSDLRKALRDSDAINPGSEAWKRVRALEADLYIVQAQQSKLVERINDATDTMLKQYPVPEGTVIQGSSITKHGKIRDAASRPYSPGLAHDLNEAMLQDAYKRNAEALAAVAKHNPEAAEACAAQIRKTTQNLSPKQKADLFDHIRAVHGEDAAQAMKSAVFGQAPAAGLTSLGGKASGPYTIRSTASTAREAADTFSSAMAKGDVRQAMTAVEDIHANMKKARDLASIPGAANTGLEVYVDDIARIRASAAKLPYSQQAAFLDTEMKALLSRGNIADAVQTGAREADLLKIMAGERDPMRKAVIREMLEGQPGPARELWEKVSTLSGKLPVAHILASLFVYFDTVSAARLQGEGKADEAARKALEALAGALGTPVVGLVTVIGNLVIDAAKDAGYSVATNPQDMDDLLAGIISVKGWESAEGFGLETSIDKLAMGFTDEGEVRRAVESAIDRAAAGSSDTPEVKEGKKKALMDTMVPKIVTAWRARREEFVKDFLALLPAFDQLMDGVTLQMDFKPAKVPLLKRKTGAKIGSGVVTVSLDGPMEDIRSLSLDLEARLRKLGGYRRLLFLSVRQKVAWSVDGKAQPEIRSYGISAEPLEKTLSFSEPGPHTVECQVSWELSPVSAITDRIDYRGQTLVLNPVKSVSYKADSGLSVEWQTPGFKDTFTPGDVVARHASKMARTYSRSAEGTVEAEDRGEDDSIAVTIAGKTKVLPGETAVLTPAYDCAEEVTAKGFTFRWKGPVRGVGDTAYFEQEKPGVYEVGLTVYRGSGWKAEKVADALPLLVEVMRPDSARFSMGIDGPARIKVGEDIRLRVVCFRGDAAAERLWEDRNVWIEWFVHGRPFDSGESLYTSATAPGTYPFEARLIWHGEGEGRVLAAATHTVNAEGLEISEPDRRPEAIDPGAPGTGGGGKDGTGGRTGPDAGRAPGAGGRDGAGVTGSGSGDGKAAAPHVASAGAGSYSMAGAPGGSVFYGSAVGISFSPPPGAPKSTSAADAAFFDALNKAAARPYTPPDNSAAVRAAEDAVRRANETVKGYYESLGSAGASSPASDLPATKGPDASFRGIGIDSGANNPVARETPDASWILGDGPAAPAPPPAPKPPPPPPPAAPGPLRFVFQSSPTVSFNPVESSDGKTTVTFDRMGAVKIWAEIHTNASGPPFITPQALYQVKGPALAIACTPEGAKIGEEVRGRVTASPAIPDNLVNYYWSAPPSGDRMEYSGNADQIGFMPKTGNSIPLQVEARSPHYNDIIGTASASYQPAAYLVEARVIGRTGPQPMVWSTVRGGLIPAPEGTYVVDEAVRVGATITGEPKPDPVRWNWAVNGGTTMRSSGLGDEITVSRSEAGTATATVTARDKNNSLLGTATVSFPVSPHEPPLPLAVAVSAGQVKIRSGARTGVQATVKGGTLPYSITWTGARGSGMSASFEAGKAGVQEVTATVTDKAGGTAAATLTITVEAVPITVTLAADRRELFPGESAALRATVAGGTPPYRFTWTGAARPAGESAVFEALRPGAASVKVSVADAWDNAGEAVVEMTVKALTLRAEVAGVSGPPPQLWDEATHTLKPLAAGKYAEGQRVKVRAVVTGGAAPDGAGFLWTAGPGGRLAGSVDKAEAEVTLTGKGTTEAGVTLALKGLPIGTAAVRIPVEVSLADLEAARIKASEWLRAQERERQFKALLAEGYALEQNKALAPAVEKYKQALALKNDPKVAAHVADLEKKMADQAEAARLLAQGGELERQGKLTEALEVYRKSMALDDTPAVRARITALEATIAAKAKAGEWVARGYQREQAQDWKGALGCYESAQKEFNNPKVDERIAFVKAKMNEAARQAAAEKAAAEKAAADKAAADRAVAAQKAAADKAAADKAAAERAAAQKAAADKAVADKVAAEKAEADRARAEAAAAAEAAAKARANAWVGKGYKFEQAQDWRNALGCYETAQKESYNPKVAERITFVKGRIQQAAETARKPPAPPAPPAPKPTPPVTPANPASRYDLNGVYKGRAPMFEANGQVVYADIILTVRQTGSAVSIRLDYSAPGGFNDSATMSGRIVGDTVQADDQKLRITDNGRTLVDEAGSRFTR